MPAIVTTPTEARGLTIVIILSILATLGMFTLIITLVILKNKRDRRKREARLTSSDPTAYIGGAGMVGGNMSSNAAGGMMQHPGEYLGGGGGGGGQRGRYQKLGGEEGAGPGGVWSVEMDERKGGVGEGRYEMVGGAGRDGDKDTYR